MSGPSHVTFSVSLVVLGAPAVLPAVSFSSPCEVHGSMPTWRLCITCASEA